MKRTLIVIVLAAAALAMLIGAAWKSRTVPLDAHIAHYTLSSETAALGDDFTTLLGSLKAAARSNQAPGEVAATLQQRILLGRDEILSSVDAIPAGGLQRERIQNNIASFLDELAVVERLTDSVLRDQTEFAEALSLLQDTTPQVSRQLQDARLPGVAQTLFELVAQSIEYAGGAGSESEIRRLTAILNRDAQIDTAIPPEMSSLIAAADTILETRDGIDSRLAQLSGSSLPEHADAVSAAATAAYNSAVSGSEGARTMLSVYAIVLLLTVGLVGLRLRSSYRELNVANKEMAVLNEGLEQRVNERTADLTSALSELKESQVQLVQAEKMSSLGQLVAGISHEINTPLLYLANNASLIQERIALLGDFVQRSARVLSLNAGDFDNRSEYQAELINGLRSLKSLLRESEIDASVEEVADLTRDSVEGLADLMEMAQGLKDFSRLDRAPVGSFDVNAGLDKTLTIARNMIKHKAEVRKFYGEIPKIECSPSKINQVFLNLITNAAQAIEDHGEIVISTKAQDDNHIVVSISDTGCGIPEENLTKIRDPFFTTKEVGTGTGLGLSIVDEIVRSHGGRLEIQSKLGEGSTFSVILPIRQPAGDVGVRDDDEPIDSDFAEAV